MARFARISSSVFSLLLAFASHANAQSIVVSTLGGASLQNWHGQVKLQSVVFEYDRPLSPRTDVAFVLAPTHIDQPRSWFGEQFGDGNEEFNAIAAALLLRRHFNRDSSLMQPYIEGGTGPMWAERRVPAATSRFNFVSQAGAGVTLRPHARIGFVAGYRFLHISNGGYSPRNPGLNVNSFVLGLRFRR